MLTFAPAAAVTFSKDGSTEYRFNRYVIAHHFCPVCGIETHALADKDGTPMIAINVNCLEGVDARALDSKAVDGASS